MNVNDVKVIIIDDHTLVRAGIARLIDSEPGLSVVGEASNVTEGADMLRRVPADVMVVDVSLGDGSGLSLVPSARAKRPTMGIVVLTMHNDDETLLAALDAGASSLVLKTPPRRGPRHGPSRRRRPPTRSPPAGSPTRCADSTQVKPNLTAREMEVLERLAVGDSVAGMAKRLYMSESTVKTHIAKLYSKLGAHNRASAVMAAIKLGFVKSDAPLPDTRRGPVCGGAPHTGPLGRPGGSDCRSEAREHPHDPDDAGADDDDHQRREDAEQHREEDLDRHLLGLLLGPLTAHQPHLLGLLAQHVGDRAGRAGRPGRSR